MSRWQPLSQRVNGTTADEALYEGVPPHLREPLLYWLECQFYDFIDLDLDGKYGGATSRLADAEAAEARALQIANMLRLQLPKVEQGDSWSRIGRPIYTKALLKLAVKSDEPTLLDIVDCALVGAKRTPKTSFRPDGKRWRAPNRPADLDTILREGGSAYRVNDAGKGLERRLDGTVTQAARQTTDRAADSSHHLNTAWQAAYGIHPDPTVAYAEAVKAVEATLIPLVLPNDPKATLGKALGHMRNTVDSWELAISNEHNMPARITPLIDFAELIWKGHRDRHAGTATASPVDPTAAEMTVHAAATIVQWLSCRGLRQRQP